MGKIKLQKIVGNLLIKLRKLYMNGTVQKILGKFCFSEQIFHRKQSLGAPEKWHSTETSLIASTDTILEAVDKRKLTAIVFLDISRRSIALITAFYWESHWAGPIGSIGAEENKSIG